MDADWAGNADNCRSTSGFTFSLGSAMVTWSNKKQPIVALLSTEVEYRGAKVATCEAIWLKRQPIEALSSTEVEYRGAEVATCKAIWLKRLQKDLQMEMSNSMTIYCDNLNSIHLAKNPVFHARTKHIEVHYHFVRERILSGEVELVHVSTDRQIVDIFTKPSLTSCGISRVSLACVTSTCRT